MATHGQMGGSADRAGLDGLPTHLAQLADHPGDEAALAALRNAFVTLGKETAGEPIQELARATENLLDRLLDGSVAPAPNTAALIAQACTRLRSLDEDPFDDLMERIDVCASGMADPGSAQEAAEPGNDPPAGIPAAPTWAAGEPPLLTEREDGSRVVPGSFADALPGRGTPPDPLAPETLADDHR